MLDWLWFLLGKLVFFTGMLKSKNAFLQPLSEEEEAELFKKMHEGDEKARDALVEHNMRLVAHVVKKYANSYEQDDLISVGSIGLIKAVSTYDGKKGTSFATFAARCIENEILMLFRSNKKFKSDVSLFEPVGADKDGNELTLMDILSTEEESVFDRVETHVTAQKLIGIMKKTLTKRECRILGLRLGLIGGTPLAQREVATLLRISRSYVSRIEKKAIEKLRAAVSEETP